MAKQTKNNTEPKSWITQLWSAAIAYVLVYAFMSWAIDSGSIWAHVLAYVSFYYAIYYTKEAIKSRFFQNKSVKVKPNVKTSKARAAKKARRK